MTGRTFRMSLGALLLSSAASLAAQDVAIIQPGAPGESSRVIAESEAIQLADTRYSPADVMFMQGMIVHHQQAVNMAALIDGRTTRDELVAVGGRIDASQEDEMTFMREWLTSRGEDAVMMGQGRMSGHAAHSGMMGMASPADMARLATLNGVAFDKLFLELMIAHHEGAVDMVKELHEAPGTAYDPVTFEFTEEVTNDQTSEIERMDALLASLSADPRATLAAGFRDAGEAISNMRMVSALPKPAGFFDPENPAGLAPPKPMDAGGAESEENPPSAVLQVLSVLTTAVEAAAGETPPTAAESEEEEEPQFGQRSPLLSFSNTDMAFSGDVLVAGNYHGFNAYQLGEDGVPTLMSSVVCPGGQGDVSIIGNLLLMSVQDTRARVDCGLQGVTGKVSEERFRGLRIFDITDITRPVQVGQVQTCRGSHTHSVVSQTDTTLIVYNSGTSRVRDEEELAGCIGNVPGDDRTALFRIDVIEIPLANPGAAKVVDSPAVFADPETGRLAGLWQGGDHGPTETGDDTQDTNSTNHCHDITVFPSLNLAAGACSGNGIIFDISDPLKPTRIDEVVDEGFAYWHSATFNNDGTKVLFTDEWGGGGRPRCRASDPKNWGANAIYEIVDGQLEFRSLYKLPAPQSDKENCVAHNGSIVPVPGRDIFVQAWYQGGISVIDFTDASNPQEIAYFDRGPISDEQLLTGGYWSAYWYKGRIYATEIARGLDVFALEPSEFLTAEEIAAAEAADMGETFNPQTQFPVTWPEDVVAQLEDARKGG